MALSTKRPSAKERLLDAVRETGATRRMNIDVDAALYRRMKRQALEEERTLSEITRELWDEYLRKHAKE
jgi:macrodomain Ter protein organizer (MatP/YcbG family)